MCVACSNQTLLLTLDLKSTWDTGSRNLIDAAVSEQSGMTYWHLLYPSVELLLHHLMEDTCILASFCRISFSTRLALDKMIMEILILKFSL